MLQEKISEVIEGLRLYSLYYSNEFTKQLKKVEKRDKVLIEKKLKEIIIPQLTNDPVSGLNIKKLKNFVPPTWRYRIGKYRIFYSIDLILEEIDFLTISLRKDAY